MEATITWSHTSTSTFNFSLSSSVIFSLFLSSFVMRHFARKPYVRTRALKFFFFSSHSSRTVVSHRKVCFGLLLLLMLPNRLCVKSVKQMPSSLPVAFSVQQNLPLLSSLRSTGSPMPVMPFLDKSQLSDIV